jgi:hypothetical protein
MLTMQTSERRTVAGASETAGSLVVRPREQPPTRLHQAPSPLQRCAPSRLSTISGAAEPKSLFRPLRLRHWIAPNIHYLNLSITGASFCIKRQRVNVSIVFEALTPSALPDNGEMELTNIAPSSPRHCAFTRVSANHSSPEASPKPLALLCTCSVSAKIS